MGTPAGAGAAATAAIEIPARPVLEQRWCPSQGDVAETGMEGTWVEEGWLEEGGLEKG